ncbi:AraC family transcriptional regulator [Mycolicibacterium frederiksbergense]|nr:AraC family transcriptional regulator [Mycolicibacterium frederiksbergense]
MAVIRGTALMNFHELVTELGGDSHALASAAHIPLDDIGRHDRFISLPNGARMLETTAATLDTPDFGRRLARRQGIEILGAVGLAGRNAATVADAFVIFDKFMSAYSPSISARMTAHLAPDLRRFEFEYLLDPTPPQAQAVELSLGVTLRVLRLFLGATYRPVAVHLPHSPLTPADDYQTYFGCPPTFCEPVGGFTLRTTDLQRPLPTDHLAHQTAVDYLADTVGDYAPATSQLVRNLVRQLLPTGGVGLTDIARHIGIHPKTLQRRLAAENATFADLVDQTRRDAAQRLLLDTDLSLDQLCRQLGYAEQSVLTRSCKRWFGTTPTAYRNSRNIAPQALPLPEIADAPIADQRY